MMYKTTGTCCKEIYVDVSEGVIKTVTFSNGCDGNLKAIAELSRGARAEDIIANLSGIKCGGKTTSCPDQLAEALRKAM